MYTAQGVQVIATQHARSTCPARCEVPAMQALALQANAPQPVIYLCQPTRYPRQEARGPTALAVAPLFSAARQLNPSKPAMLGRASALAGPPAPSTMPEQARGNAECEKAEEPVSCTQPDQSSNVVLHVYDVSTRRRVRFANMILRPFGTGAYHAGIEVHSSEWSYGCRGVFDCEPSQCEDHHYRTSHGMGATALTSSEVQAIVQDMTNTWHGHDYDLCRQNCTHFSSALCERLGVGALPPWVTRIAAIGARLDDVVRKGKERRDASPEDGYEFGDFTRGMLSSGRSS